MKKYKKGDTVPITMDGFMGIQFPANAVISDILYQVRADTGNGQYAEMVLSEDELESRIIKNKEE